MAGCRCVVEKNLELLGNAFVGCAQLILEAKHARTFEATTPTSLLERTSWGDKQARDRLLERHRARLRTMIAVRLDRRYQARVDPSDVVQDVLKEAAAPGRLPEGSSAAVPCLAA